MPSSLATLRQRYPKLHAKYMTALDVVARGVVAPLNARKGWRHPRAIPLRPSVHLDPEFGYDGEAEIKAAVARVADSTYVSFEKLATLWQQVLYLDRYGIPGSLVECGVYKGGCVAMMALAHMKTHPAPSRTLDLFDSFEGLPEPDASVDGEQAIAYAGNRAEGAMEPIGACVGPLDGCRALLEEEISYPATHIRYHVGWFETTVPRDAGAVGDIALLRLDGDWYESTKICLDHLYDRVVPGGVVVVDDYGHWPGCRKAVDELIASRPDEPILLSHIDYAGRYWVKGPVGAEAPPGNIAPRIHTH